MRENLKLRKLKIKNPQLRGWRFKLNMRKLRDKVSGEGKKKPLSQINGKGFWIWITKTINHNRYLIYEITWIKVSFFIVWGHWGCLHKKQIIIWYVQKKSPLTLVLILHLLAYRISRSVRGLVQLYPVTRGWTLTWVADKFKNDLRVISPRTVVIPLSPGTLYFIFPFVLNQGKNLTALPRHLPENKSSHINPTLVLHALPVSTVIQELHCDGGTWDIVLSGLSLLIKEHFISLHTYRVQ